MFAFSVTLKLLVWYLVLKHGDAGQPSRPWILGAIVALIFSSFDIFLAYHNFNHIILISVAYLVAALIATNIYYRVHSIVGSLIVVALGTPILFFGVPCLVVWLEP